jgi:hypothetical protein
LALTGALAAQLLFWIDSGEFWRKENGITPAQDIPVLVMINRIVQLEKRIIESM